MILKRQSEKSIEVAFVATSTLLRLLKKYEINFPWQQCDKFILYTFSKTIMSMRFVQIILF